MTLGVTHYWLIAGVAFLALEAFGLPGVGFFFAGLGALTAGALLEAGVLAPEEILPQFAVFLSVTIVSAALLWRAIQKLFPRRHNAKGYDDVIGATAIAATDLRPGEEGTVKWSGTLMKAELAPNVAMVVPAGAHVTIVEARGATLVVAPKLVNPA